MQVWNLRPREEDWAQGQSRTQMFCWLVQGSFFTQLFPLLLILQQPTGRPSPPLPSLEGELTTTSLSPGLAQA